MLQNFCCSIRINADRSIAISEISSRHLVLSSSTLGVQVPDGTE